MELLRIKRKHLGKVISRGVSSFVLSDDLTQRELLHIKVMVSADFVESYTKVEVQEEAQIRVELYEFNKPKPTKRKKNDNTK